MTLRQPSFDNGGSKSTEMQQAATRRLMKKNTKNKKDNDGEDAARARFSFRWRRILPFLPVLILLKAIRQNMSNAKDPLIYMIPNFLLFTPFRTLTHRMWDRVLQYDTSREHELMGIPELQAVDFSYEALRHATRNWQQPVVVRGIFRNTTAVRRWHDPVYVSSHIGQYEVTLLHKAYAKGLENDRDARSVVFRDAYPALRKEKYSSKYFFFPEKSRAKKGTEMRLFMLAKRAPVEQNNVTDPALGLSVALNKMVREDLELDRIWPGFGSSRHRTYQGEQFIAGWGNPDPTLTTGSNWHCAPGNNWFTQIHGRKRWFFLSPKYSAYLHPQRDGLNTMATSSHDLIKMQKYLPVQFVDLEPGDMIYNPDWQWHAIQNHEGFNIGIPIREFNISLALRNNNQYTIIAGINRGLSRWFGFTYGLQEHLNKKIADE